MAYHDPNVPRFPRMRSYAIDLSSQPLRAELLARYDGVLIVTDHDAIDYELIGRHADLVVDSRNAMARVSNPKATIVKA